MIIDMKNWKVSTQKYNNNTHVNIFNNDFKIVSESENKSINISSIGTPGFGGG